MVVTPSNSLMQVSGIPLSQAGSVRRRTSCNCAPVISIRARPRSACFRDNSHRRLETLGWKLEVGPPDREHE